MWAFTDQVIGFMKVYSEILPSGSAGNNFSQIQTSIQDSSLLGGSDLDVFFDQYHLLSEGVQNCTPTDQRLRDISVARNETLDILIPELTSNITMSFFSSNLLS
jgi:hypothetical protein